MTDSPATHGHSDAAASALDRLAGRLGRDQVFGPPVEQAGAVVLPVARVRAGGGSGGGGEGTGIEAGPAGAFSISAKGKVSWHPAVDVNRIVLGGQIAITLLGLGLACALRRRRPRRR